jgi:hypothetical protein
VSAPVRPRTRPPSCKARPPFVMLEGTPKSGRSWKLAELTGSDRIGEAFWLQVGETSADEYGLVPGAAYEILEHDGTWSSMYGAVCAVWEYARHAEAEGKPPVLLAVDSGSAIWGLLSDWVDFRNRRTEENKRRLAANPDAELKPAGRNLWNDADSRWDRLMTKFMTFHGVSVMIADGREVSATGPNGQPDPGGRKDWSVRVQGRTGHRLTLWVRMTADEGAKVMAASSVIAPIRHGQDPPKQLEADWTLERLIFDVLQYRPDQARNGQLVMPRQDATPEEYRDELCDPGTSSDRRVVIAEEIETKGLATAEVEFHGALVMLATVAEMVIAGQVTAAPTVRRPVRTLSSPGARGSTRQVTVAPTVRPVPSPAESQPMRPGPAPRAVTDQKWLANARKSVQHAPASGLPVLKASLARQAGQGKCSADDWAVLEGEINAKMAQEEVPAA